LKVRNLGLSYALAIIGLFGLAGIHRFYLGKPVTGLLWLLTGGLFGIGTIYDLITMQTQVDETNRNALAASQSAGALPAAPAYAYGYAYAYGPGHGGYGYPQQAYAGQHHAAYSGHAVQQVAQAAQPVPQQVGATGQGAWYAVPIAGQPSAAVALELRVLQLARSHGGRVTAPLAAAELGVSIAQADEKLTEIAKAGHANVDIDIDGVVVYDFPSLRL
jgi:hypothetical protein